MKRHLILTVAVLMILLLATTYLVGCQKKEEEKKIEYPTKAVTIICPWAAGGGTDALARLMADAFSKKFDQPFVVVNKTGGGGATGHTAGALAAPDGYTLTLVTLEISTIHWMGMGDVSVDNYDFVIQLNQDPSSVIVKADAPWKDLKELLDDIRNNPGKFSFSGSGAGTIWDLSRIGMLHTAGIPVDSVKWVPTAGAAPSITELLGGHVDVITCSLPEAKSQIEAGLLRPLAIMADERDPRFPDVPTLKEQGVDWSSGTWRGIAVPKGTPQEIIDIIYNAAMEIANSDEFKDFMNKKGFGIKIRGPKEFEEFARQEDKRWEEIIKLGGYGK